MNEQNPRQLSLVPKDEVLHPMWNVPSSKERDEMPEWMWGVCRSIAQQLTRFNGREEEMSFPIAFCQEVYDKVLAQSTSREECIGRLILTTRHWHSRLTRFVKDGQPCNSHLYVRDRNVIRELGARFIDVACADGVTT